MKNKPLTLSIIIPVYNEERRLRACLEAIAAQTVLPDEVIIVNNNSTDSSVEIAQEYEFVRLIHEKKQGFTYARNAGFNSAKSDILARIDTDAILSKNWVERTKNHFHDKQLTGLTGLGSTDFFPRIHWPKVVVWSWLYFQWTRMVFRLPVLWGANMAMRRSAWEQIKSEVIMDNQLVHEDQDISLCILEHGGQLKKDNRLRITTDGQTYHYWPKLLHYTKRMYATRRIHAQRPAYQALHKYPSRPVTWLLMGTFGVIIFPPFFLWSLVSFPFDWLLSRVFKVQSWLD